MSPVSRSTTPLVKITRQAEIAAGVLANKKGRVGFFSFLINVTPMCDCWNFSSAPAVPDIGFLASKDPVAIDQAAAELVMRAVMDGALDGRGPDERLKETFLGAHGASWNRQLACAQEIGLGSRRYQLVRIDD